MQKSIYILGSLFLLLSNGCTEQKTNMQVFETSKSGHQLTQLKEFEIGETIVDVVIHKDIKKQRITGFGGAFTESTAYLLHQMSEPKQTELLDAYFGLDGAQYSLTRTHMNSCDFSRFHYSYDTVVGDTQLEHFSIQPDKEHLIPMIKGAMQVSKDGFKIIASPWTAPPWMKDNNDWVGGKLLPEYYATWALFFKKYAQSMATEGINLWGFTVENEPLGNGNNWESMHFTPEEMSQFVQEHLGPELEKSNLDDLVILGYDQNRADLKEWVDGMFPSGKSKNYFDGTAVHWYESTYDYFPDELDYAHEKAPDKYLIQTEACVDSEIPVWKDDQWYWEKNATDWGYDWASDDKKYLHPKYIASHRYARDIIGCLNHWVDGWIDWNMILDRQGGPNWFKNWCVAPIIVDPTTDEIYYTPLYYIMSHFSKFIRPEARVLQTNHIHTDLMITAAVNKDKSLVIVVFNPTNNMITYRLKGIGDHRELSISPNAIQTIIVQP